MTLIEIVALIGFILGAILHTVLSILIIQRRNKKGSELVFLFLVISVAMWHYGNVISLFSVMLFGKNIPVINQSSDVFACFGMGIIPSLLLHTSLLFLLESGWKIKRKIMRTMVILIYLPVIPLSFMAGKIIFFEEVDVIMSVSPLVKVFITWLLFSIIVSAVTSRILSGFVLEDEEQNVNFSLFLLVALPTFANSFLLFLESPRTPLLFS